MRIDRGMTQEELAKAIETTKQNIHKYESGIITNIPITRIRDIAKALHCSPADLMGWEQPEPNPVDLMAKKLHENPKLRMLFSKTSKMSEKDMDAILTIVSAMTQERDGE